jgi:hypothetical protein
LRSLQGQEYTDQYFIEYQREDNGPWFRFRDRRGEQVSRVASCLLQQLQQEYAVALK